jgi:hypothetical protein
MKKSNGDPKKKKSTTSTTKTKLSNLDKEKKRRMAAAKYPSQKKRAYNDWQKDRTKVINKYRKSKSK